MSVVPLRLLGGAPRGPRVPRVERPSNLTLLYYSYFTYLLRGVPSSQDGPPLTSQSSVVAVPHPVDMEAALSSARTGRKPNFWQSVFGGSGRNEVKYTVATLSQLYSQLSKVSAVTARNRDMVVESLRTVAELLIWGDKHDPAFFEFFLEQNMLATFWRLLASPSPCAQVTRWPVCRILVSVSGSPSCSGSRL